MFYCILTAASQVRLYSTSYRDVGKPPSFDAYRWDHKKDPTRSTDNEKQMTYHYLIIGGLYMPHMTPSQCEHLVLHKIE